MSDEFCPRQIIFSISGDPGVIVTATEHDGSIDFVLDVDNEDNKAADLRGLFFDMTEGKMAGLTVTGGDGLLTETQIGPNTVIDLGNGANMQGATKAGFDVGLEWGSAGAGRNVVDTVHFTLSNSAGDLTLDDIAHQRFGARTTSVGQKLISIAPAAPDANDDSYNIFEDNAAGLNSPSKTPVDYKMLVLANDTDGDGDTLHITSIHQQPEHGTVSIADGGTSLVYTPQTDWAGQITFEYCVSDGQGGQDSATVTLDITPVADIPLFDVTVEGTPNVNEVLINVTASQNDADSSEYLDSIVASGLPSGVTITPVSVDPATEPDSVSQAFLLTLPLNQDSDFDLTFTATSVETGNGDTQTGTHVVPIQLDYNETSVAAQFNANDQSIWSSGSEFTFDDQRFLGIDTGLHNAEVGGFFHAGLDYNFKMGFNSDLHFEGGSIDATANYDVNVATNYNRTVDTLLINTAALLSSAVFDTEGPEGHYILDFLYDIYLHGYAGIDGIGDVGLGTIDFDGSFNIINVDNTDIAGTIELPAPLNSLSVNYAWPDITTNGTLPPNPGTSHGESNNIVELNLDLDTLVTQLLGIPNVLDPESIDFLGVAYADPDFVDADVIGGANLIQDFKLAMGSLVGTLSFEDGSSQSFTIGDSLQLANASAIDAAGNDNGDVDFTLSLTPNADLTNDSSVGLNIGFHLKLLSVELGYDIGIDSGSTTLGPLYEETWTAPVAEIPVYSNTFNLAFSDGNYAFAA